MTKVYDHPPLLVTCSICLLIDSAVTIKKQLGQFKTHQELSSPSKAQGNNGESFCHYRYKNMLLL